MELEGSLPHSKQPATCSYPEPDRSSPSPLNQHFFKIHFNIVLPWYPHKTLFFYFVIKA